MVKVRCGVKLVDTKEMQMFDLEQTMDMPVKVDSVCWYGHLFGKDNNNVLRTSDYWIKGTRKRINKRNPD